DHPPRPPFPTRRSSDLGLLAEAAAPGVREERVRSTQWLAQRLHCRVEEPREFLARLLEWLGRSESPLVVSWLEDLWLEEVAVNRSEEHTSELQSPCNLV